MGHIILFEEIEFRGDHRHVVAAEPDLGRDAPFAWSGGPVSCAVLAGVWQLCRDAAFGRPHPTLLGPGLYAWTELHGLAEGDVASLRPVDQDPAILGEPPQGYLTLFSQEGLRGKHRHLFGSAPEAGAAAAVAAPFPAASAVVEPAEVESACWILHDETGARDAERLAPGLHASLPAAPWLASVATDRAREGEQDFGHLILFEGERFGGAHRHVYRAEPELAAGPGGLARVGSFWVEFGAWAFFRRPGFHEPLPAWDPAALAAQDRPPPYFAPDRQARPLLVPASRGLLTSDAPRSLSLPGPHLHLCRGGRRAPTILGVVVGVRASPRLWIDGQEVTEQLALRHDYDGWAGLWCLEIDTPARLTPDIHAAAAAAGPYGVGAPSAVTWFGP